MNKLPRREFLRRTAGVLGAATAVSMLPVSIRRALAIAATVETGTIQDVQHVVILMQENRSFDHYFGSLRGVRGFGDPFPIALQSGQSVWYQSNGTQAIPPYHLNPAVSSALLVPDCPHGFSDAQAAWNQGLYGEWPLHKTGYSMGYYLRADIPFQFALAEAFTLCDSYHCSLTAGTDPNRVVLFSGANADPSMRAQGINCNPQNAELSNYRCNVSGQMPAPGYTFQGNPFTWSTLPDLLQAANISWRIYQDPNNNWNGLMHGGLAFESFRQATAASGSAIYQNGMTQYTIGDLQNDVTNGSLPSVSWVLPSPAQSEHPGASNPDAGAYFISQVIDAITANPIVWSQTALFILFDENDGLFDHVPPPAVPSYTNEGVLAGGATMSLAGEYFDGSTGGFLDASTLTGTLRPWGMGARVPAYVVSPWSRGGWVNSQVFDHSSIGMFLEQRFGIEVSSISPWRRAVSGDLTSAFDFASPNASPFPVLPDMSNYAAIIAAQANLPLPAPPGTPQALYQERGFRSARALPYELFTTASISGADVSLTFTNSGAQGAVFHVYDQLNLGRIPRRYTVEAGKSFTDIWGSADGGAYDLVVYAPNGFVRQFSGNTLEWSSAGFRPEIFVGYVPAAQKLSLEIHNGGSQASQVTVSPNNPFIAFATRSVTIAPVAIVEVPIRLRASANWYDFTVSGTNVGRRFAGRMETGRDGISDPAMATNI